MIKKLTFLLVIAITTLSCEAGSIDEATFSQDNDSGQIDTDIDQEKIIDQYNETDGGLNN